MELVIVVAIVVCWKTLLISHSYYRVVDRIWGEWVKEPWPVSTCVQVVRLAKVDAKVEIEVVAEAN
jgi:2-iminobutanoate/2-iminopropanoate deaminase